jgi:hypothetical protein
MQCFNLTSLFHKCLRVKKYKLFYTHSHGANSFDYGKNLIELNYKLIEFHCVHITISSRLEVNAVFKLDVLHLVQHVVIEPLRHILVLILGVALLHGGSQS